MADKLVVQGAREHNLKGIDLELPRDKLIVFTGLSGSGKSSLAFDTIYAEGQRRYVESLSAYARQFLGQMDKPDVDFIEGLSPAISIDQKSASRNPRSTVGTITEVYDYLRLLFARIGVPHCPNDGTAVSRQTPQQIVDRIMEMEEGTRFQVLAPVVHGRKGTYDTLLEDLAKQGFARAIVDGDLIELGPDMHLELERYEMHTIQVVVDRLVAKPDMARRLTDSLETALALADGIAEIQIVPRDREPEPDDTLTFSQHFACPTCGMSFQDLAPRNFSFNSPYGACQACDGLGTRYEVDPNLVVPDPDLAVDDGAIAPWAGGHSTYFHRLVEAVMSEVGIRRGTPWKDLTKKQRRRCSTARASPRSRSPTRTATAAPAPTTPTTRARSRTCPGATARSTPTPSGSRSRATCGRCRARRARASASTPSRSPCSSTATTSPTSATSRSARRPRSSPASSCPSGTR